MISEATKFRRSRLKWLASVVGPSAILSAIMIAEKPDGPADPQRFVMTVAFFTVLISGVVLAGRQWRQLKSAKRDFRLAGAAQTMHNTADFLRQEEGQATRGLRVMVLGVGLSTALAVISRWPQASPLGKLTNIFEAGALFATALGLVLLFNNRRAFWNTIFLRGYLRQQARTLGFKANSFAKFRRLKRNLTRSVKSAGEECFTAGVDCETGAPFVWSFEDGFKNLIITGQPGSGKTVAVQDSSLEAILAQNAKDPARKCAALLLDPQGQLPRKVRELCRRHGRMDDLVIVSPEDWDQHGGTWQSAAYNPCDTDMSALELAAAIFAAMKLLGTRATDTFFQDNGKLLLAHAITLLRAKAPGDPTNLQELYELVIEPVGEEAGPIYAYLCHAILSRYPDPSAIPVSLQSAFDYFESVWRELPEKQRHGISGTVIQALGEFQGEPIRYITSGRSTVRMADVIDQGKILVINMPLAKSPRLATVMSVLAKMDFQNEVLKRVGKVRPSLLFADEYHTLASLGDERSDAEFFSLSRQCRHINLVAVQNLNSLLKKTQNKNEVMNLVANCATKIMLRQTDTETNNWASDIFGERNEPVVTSSEPASLDGLRQAHKTTYSRSFRKAKVVPPEEFTKLAIPERGVADRQFSESIIHLATREGAPLRRLLWKVNRL